MFARGEPGAKIHQTFSVNLSNLPHFLLSTPRTISHFFPPSNPVEQDLMKESNTFARFVSVDDFIHQIVVDLRKLMICKLYSAST